MFRICYADLAKAFKNKDLKRRPVVVIKDLGRKVVVLKITGRSINDKYHVRMNHFLIYGFCDVGNIYTIDKKYILSYVRDCTTSEVESIKINLKNFQKSIDI